MSRRRTGSRTWRPRPKPGLPPPFCPGCEPSAALPGSWAASHRGRNHRGEPFHVNLLGQLGVRQFVTVRTHSPPKLGIGQQLADACFQLPDVASRHHKSVFPELIHQGENGFVVPGGHGREVEGRNRELLADPELRRRMGANGYELAHTQLTEQVYVERFTAMVAATVRGGP